jgi:hypothetical protein
MCIVAEAARFAFTPSRFARKGSARLQGRQFRRFQMMKWLGINALIVAGSIGTAWAAPAVVDCCCECCKFLMACCCN